MSDEKVRPFLSRPAVIDWLQWKAWRRLWRSMLAESSGAMVDIINMEIQLQLKHSKSGARNMGAKND